MTYSIVQRYRQASWRHMSKKEICRLAQWCTRPAPSCRHGQSSCAVAAKCCVMHCKAVLLLVSKCDLTKKLVRSHFDSLAVFQRCAKESLVEPLATPVSDSRLLTTMWYTVSRLDLDIGKISHLVSILSTLPQGGGARLYSGRPRSNKTCLSNKLLGPRAG